MTNLFDELKTLLLQDGRFMADDDILKNRVMEFALKMDKDLLKLLLIHEQLKAHFFVDMDGILVFDQQKFIRFVNNKAFLPDSYTSFKNKIGLTIGQNYLQEQHDVALVWPYKDCVLQGGQDKEDAKRDEIFWNEILAPDEIDRLFDPKVLTNFYRYDVDGEHSLTEISDTDNLIIKGNNLLALHSLKKRFMRKVKLIYIDPPYNTGNGSFGYNDSFYHSTWLTFIKNRLEVARTLLQDDGSIWINIDDEGVYYLKLVCDEIFGRENFVSSVVWQKKYSPQNDAQWLSDMHDFILVYAKNKSVWRPNLLPRTQKMDKRFKNSDNDPRGPWKSADLSVKTYSASNDYPITTPSGRVVYPPESRCWVVSEEKFQALVKDNRIWFGEDGNNVPSLKKFLSEVKDGITPTTLWLRDAVGDNQEGKREIKTLFKDNLFSTPKPERLLQRIVQLTTASNDLVLDFFAGSGTTAAVAHKMGRQFITIEQMDYTPTITVKRLKKVVGQRVKPADKLLEEIDYDRGGISKEVAWQGGGDFIYCELRQWNQTYLDKIETASTKDDLQTIWQEMQEKAFLSYQLDFQQFEQHATEFLDLSIDDQKKFLLEVLDKNQLYVNLSEIDDVVYGVSETDKTLNRKFYGLE